MFSFILEWKKSFREHVLQKKAAEKKFFFLTFD